MSGWGVEPTAVPIEQLGERLRAALEGGAARLGALSAHRALDGRVALLTLLLQPGRRASLWESVVESAEGHFPSITAKLPQAHWFERLIADMFGLTPQGHPRLKSVLLHEAWPADFHPLAHDGTVLPLADGPRKSYRFMQVKGEGVYEIPVGPIHAGIIEPGHFRFSCLGELIENLEIRLGYLHRGVEEQMTRMPWRRARFLAEAVSSDTVVGHALAHAEAIEALLGLALPGTSMTLRALALEIERLACHLGDLGGICADIGYAGGARIFGQLRGAALGLGERLTGSRFLTGYVRPGGVSHPLDDVTRLGLIDAVDRLSDDYAKARPLLLDNATALERMQGTGRLRPSLAANFGLVGPAGRASGSDYDARAAFATVPYSEAGFTAVTAAEGDVLARVRVRADEITASLRMCRFWLEGLRAPHEFSVTLPQSLPSQRFAASVVEGWRGEIVHLLRTDRNGAIRRYRIKDPSFNNWTGLAIAVRGELVPDFPLCNKSFSLSYSGNDL
jgi:Ni,Fe-hydrogenase III large subunit/Ni,Fe-hydrogenase III component G